MLKTDLRVEYCHSQSLASFLIAPIYCAVGLQFTVVCTQDQLDQCAGLKKNNLQAYGSGKADKTSLLSTCSDPTRQLQESRTGRREHAPFETTLQI